MVIGCGGGVEATAGVEVIIFCRVVWTVFRAAHVVILLVAKVVNGPSKVVCDCFATAPVLILLVLGGEVVLFVGELVADGVGVGIGAEPRIFA